MPSVTSFDSDDSLLSVLRTPTQRPARRNNRRKKLVSIAETPSPDSPLRRSTRDSYVPFKFDPNDQAYRYEVFLGETFPTAAWELLCRRTFAIYSDHRHTCCNFSTHVFTGKGSCAMSIKWWKLTGITIQVVQIRQSLRCPETTTCMCQPLNVSWTTITVIEKD